MIRFGGRSEFGVEAGIERWTCRFECRRVALEMREFFGKLEMNPFERSLERRPIGARCGSANDRRDNRSRPLLDPYRELTNLEAFEAVTVGHAERVFDEIADRRKHARNQVGVANL